MSKFSNVERVVNYAIIQNVGVLAAVLMARRLLDINLTDEETEQAEIMYSNVKHALLNDIPLDRVPRQR